MRLFCRQNKADTGSSNNHPFPKFQLLKSFSEVFGGKFQFQEKVAWFSNAEVESGTASGFASRTFVVLLTRQQIEFKCIIYLPKNEHKSRHDSQV